MKKLLALFLSLVLVMCTATVFADDTVLVTVTISDGALQVVQLPVEIIDTDDDGVLTLNDALCLAHEIAYEGGANAGFGSESSEWGITLTMLWGVMNGGSYGYCINNEPAMSLSAPIADGDSIYAYVYSDTASFTDMYCWFDRSVCDAEAGSEIILTLTGTGYDENWAPVNAPVSGASVTIDGEVSGLITDENGQFTLSVTDDATHIISAFSNTQVLVPPFCVLNSEG